MHYFVKQSKWAEVAPFALGVHTNARVQWQQWRPTWDAVAVQPPGTTLPREGTPLTAKFFHLTFLHLIDQCGFDAAKFNPHSLHIGAATTAARAGLPSNTIERLVRWRSSTYETYTRRPDTPIRHLKPWLLPSNIYCLYVPCLPDVMYSHKPDLIQFWGFTWTTTFGLLLWNRH